MATELQVRDATRKAETVKKLLALAELVASDGCDLSYHNLRIEGERIPYHPDIHWTKELLWGGRRTITLTLIVQPSDER